MTLFVRRVISTLQGGVDAELGPKTLVVGPNATGKTALTRSIELALTGTASDIQGRDEVAKAIELLSLATPGKDLESTVILSDGTHAKFELRRKLGKKGAFSSSAVEPLRPPSVDPEKVLPLRTLRDNILGKPENARRFFLSYSVREITRNDVLTRLAGSLHGLYEEAIIAAKGTEPNRPEIDKLLMAQEWADKRAGESNRESNAATRVTNDLGQGLPPPPTEAEYNEAKNQLVAAKKAVETAVLQYQSHSQRAELDGKLNAMRGQLEQVKTRLAAAQAYLGTVEGHAAKLAPIPPEPTALVPGQRAVLNAVLYHAEIGANVCYCCRTNVPPTEWAGRAELARAAIRDDELGVKAAVLARDALVYQHRRKDEMLAGARFEVTQLEEQVKAGTQALNEITETIGLVTNGTQPQSQTTISDARAMAAQAEDRVRSMEQAVAAWESARKSRDAAASAEAESGRWAQLAKACSDVVRELLDFGVQSFCTKVQMYLPTTDRFGLRLRDGAREVCQFGLWRGDSLFVALSGAEWARVTAALAAVCGPVSEDRLAVIKPEERAFDPQTLTDVLTAFTRVPQQVILESPVYPTTVPAGWMLVETGAVAKPAPVKAAAPQQRAPAGPGPTLAGPQLASDPPTLAGPQLASDPLVR